MLKRLSLLTLSLLSLSISEASASDSRLKKLVFEDCVNATKEASLLVAEPRSEFISYLGRILKMQTGVQAELMIDAGTTPLIGHPTTAIDGLRGQNIWQIFEPSRELEAKRCSAHILAGLAPDSFISVPILVDLATSLTTPPDLRESIESSLWTIVEKVRATPTFAITKEQVAALVGLLGSDASAYLASNVLAELHDRTLPLLADEFFLAEKKKRATLQALLFRADKDGTTLGPRLLERLSSADPAIRAKAAHLLGELKPYRLQTLPSLLSHLNEPQLSVADAAGGAIDKLGEALKAGDRVVLDEAQLQVLLTELASRSPERRSALENIVSYTDYTDSSRLDRIWSLFGPDRDEDLRTRVIRIVAAQLNKRKIDGDRIIEGLYDPSSSVRLLAVESVVSMPDRAEEIGNAFLRVLKGSSSTASEQLRQELVIAISDVMLKLPPVTARERMIPYLVETFSQPVSLARESSGGTSHEQAGSAVFLPSMRLLETIGKSAIPAVLKVLKSSDPLVRRRAASVLAGLVKQDSSQLRALVGLLGDSSQEVRKEVVLRLVSLGELAKPELERLYRAKKPEERSAAAEVLAQLGEPRPELAESLRDLFSRGSCAEKIRSLPALIKSDPAFKEKVQPFILQCLQRAEPSSQTLLSALQLVVPLSDDAQNLILEIAGSPTPDRFVQRAVIEQAERFGIAPEKLQPFLRRLLSGGDVSIRGYLLDYLSQQRDLSRLLLVDLNDLLKRDDIPANFRVSATIAVANVEPQSVDYEKLLIRELDGEGFSGTLLQIANLRPDLAVPVLSNALRQVSIERRHAVIERIGKFGLQAVSARESLLGQIKSSDPLLRYQTAVALIRIDPDDADVVHLLRNELIGRFSGQLLQENLPLETRKAVEMIIQNPRTTVEQSAAEQLLSSMVVPAS